MARQGGTLPGQPGLSLSTVWIDVESSSWAKHMADNMQVTTYPTVVVTKMRGPGKQPHLLHYPFSAKEPSAADLLNIWLKKVANDELNPLPEKKEKKKRRSNGCGVFCRGRFFLLRRRP